MFPPYLAGLAIRSLGCGQMPIQNPASQGRLPGVPRAAGAVDRVLSDAMRLSRLPDKEASRCYMGSLQPALKVEGPQAVVQVSP